jgi:hypothetical protein
VVLGVLRGGKSGFAGFIYDYQFAGAGKVMERLDNRA